MSGRKAIISLLLLIFIVGSTSVAQDEGSEEATPSTTPCEADEAFSAFDFWLGDWKVHTADGTYAGENSIRKVHSGCLVTESWRGAQGSIGTSINFLDKSTNEWVQVWNDAGGSQIHIRGGPSGGGMRLAGRIHYISNGNTFDFRGLWTPLSDGRVRQFFEQSADGGETWTAWFEGFYSPVAAD